MKKKNLRLGMLVIASVFGMLVVGCNNDSTGLNNSYTEGDVYIAELNVMMHYYFSKTPEGIEQAAFDNGITSINPPIKNATWVLNPSLASNVKDAMNSRGASYSGTVYVEGGITKIVVNRKNDGSWYSAFYTLE